MADGELTAYVRAEFERLANPDKAPAMAAYMKTEMPFYGVQKPERIPVYKEMCRRFAPDGQDAYQDNVRALWSQRHREEKYAAIEYAAAFAEYINAGSLPLFESMVREGAWWDFVDAVAIVLVGGVLLKERESTRPVMERWIDDDDLWIRRTALISQNHHKKQTEKSVLFDHCLRRAEEREFFIRKAIGWALREYSYHDPEGVKGFLLENRDRLSPLSFKEGARQLVRAGKLRL